MVPTNKPPMIKSSIERDKMVRIESVNDVCMYLCLGYKVIYIGLCLSSHWRLSMEALPLCKVVIYNYFVLALILCQI